jgi:hypothetical protein
MALREDPAAVTHYDNRAPRDAEIADRCLEPFIKEAGNLLVGSGDFTGRSGCSLGEQQDHRKKEALATKPFPNPQEHR